MGYGTYSVSNSTVRSRSYSTLTSAQIFTEHKLGVEMNPANTIRECLDSEDHPNTIPIIIGLDVTGSMGHVPDAFIRNEMTVIMESLYQSGLKDAQILFVGIGDHECDRAPLQVGQFEANDQLLDKWLKLIFLEKGGGGNAGESYLLAWEYAAKHTKIDSFDKRGKKGFVFTIGDEPTLMSVPKSSQKNIFGENAQYEEESATSLLQKARDKYNVFHLHLTETSAGSSNSTQDGWKQLLGQNAIILNSHKEIAKTIAKTIKEVMGSSAQINEPAPLVSSVKDDKESEMML